MGNLQGDVEMRPAGTTATVKIANLDEAATGTNLRRSAQFFFFYIVAKRRDKRSLVQWEK